ncbi:hypothetical protein OKN36_09700 [Furfurilactobacillus sp. OKN36]
MVVPKTQSKLTSSTINPSLTQANYYEPWTDKAWLSPTFFKKFVACEAEAVAEIKGEYKPDFGTALLQGNFLHSYFESVQAHRAFIEANKKKLMTQKGELRADFTLVEGMITKLEHDDVFNGLYQGEKEVVVTGDVFGTPWKGKIDCLNLDQNYFVDLKTTRDIHKNYGTYRNPHNFIDEYNYSLQLGVYELLLEEQYGRKFTPYIVAISKEKTPEAALYKFHENDFEEDYDVIRSYQGQVNKLIAGDERPSRCEHCDYCKLTSQIDEIHDSHYL